MGLCCGKPAESKQYVEPQPLKKGGGKGPQKSEAELLLEQRAVQFVGYYKLELAKLLPQIGEMMVGVKKQNAKVDDEVMK